jgi:CRP-like cAMP-binding protein
MSALPPLEFLAANGWLAQTPPAFRQAVLSRCALHRFQRGDTIYRAGDPAGGLWGLADGALSIEIEASDLGQTLSTHANPGFWGGEASMITREPRSIGLRAARPSVLAHLTVAAFDQIAAADPQAWRWISLLTLKHLRNVMREAHDLMIRDSERRAIAVMLRLARRSDPRANAEARPARVDVTQERLAELCNLSRSALSEILGRLQHQRLIALGYGRFDLLDPSGLRRMLAA